MSSSSILGASMSISQAVFGRLVRWIVSEDARNLALLCLWALLGITATAAFSDLPRPADPTSIADSGDGR
jgi:hypothetical protein